MSLFAARQQDEVNSVESIYGDIFTDITPQGLIWNKKPSPHFQIRLETSLEPDKPPMSLILDIEFTPTYPKSPPLVRLLNPKNLLKHMIVAMEKKIRSLIKEYAEEEVSFIIISEIKDMLDDFHSNSEKVLSLEEERAVRLQKERLQLEQEEAMRRREEESAQRRQNEELNQQILKIQDEYYEDTLDGITEEEDGSAELVPPNADDFIVFEKPMVGFTESPRVMFTFRTVLEPIRHKKPDLLSSIAEQQIVTPYIAPVTATKLQGALIPTYLLSDIMLTCDHWLTDEGKKEIQLLESELQNVMNVKHENVSSLVGFQIDRQEKGWRIRLLTDYSPQSQSLQEILAAQHKIVWSTARTWLIQVLPAIESLHNIGLVHKAICPLTVFSIPNGLSASTLKLCHISYGYRLLRMAHEYPNNNQKPKDPFNAMGNSALWIAPELSDGFENFTVKSDIWDLGVLFMKVMLGNNALETYKTPSRFLSNFKASEFPNDEDNANLVFDLLSKMLQKKLFKRPSPLELNAVRFVRDGPVAIQQNNQLTHASGSPSHLAGMSHVNLAASRRHSNHHELLDVGESKTRNVGRYERDFEEVGIIGKGGFGEVVKARNRLEGTFYAIKKIKHRADKLDSLLSEVLSLARLNHQYIVRYYGTWVEEIDEAGPAGENEDEASDDDFESPVNVRSTSFLASQDSSFQIDFISNSFDPQLDIPSEDDQFEFANSTENDESTSGADLWSDITSNEGFKKEQIKSSKAKRSILYIQMEFCENNTLLNLIEQGLPYNPNEYWRLFRQLLEAVSYIHQSGFIHRDLKPMNIFIDKSNNIKVGDFGLAKNSQFSLVVLTNNQVEAANKDFSTVVGTVFYTAREVATGDYDEKVDMYSLGIVFFEMCYPLSTGMERAQTLNELRLSSINFPSNFVESKYKMEKKIIKVLLDHNPKERPSASELLQSGWLPVEHQDQVIKEALRSLADPASPWQHQVRETLFNQPYLLAHDLMFDNSSRNSRSIENTMRDYLLFSNMIDTLFGIFRLHGAIEDYSSDILLPKSQNLAAGQAYDVLDRSGTVLLLPYDLILPKARFLSRNNIDIAKLYCHEFVYRPNIRGPGTPDKYSSVNFDITTHDRSLLPVNDAECLKVVDEILHHFPCFKAKGSQCLILINHSDIINSVITFAFGNIGISDRKRHEVIGVLSQLGIEKSPEEIKRYLREDFNVPHTVTRDLVDTFNFMGEPEDARRKLKKAMVDSPYFVKVERALVYILDVLSILRKFGVKSGVYLSPLGNYNCQYYTGGIMFQAIFRLDTKRRFARVLTGGRYDSLVSSLANVDINKAITPHAVGLLLTSTFLFLLLKSRKIGPNEKYNETQWRGTRCNVLITSTNKSLVRLAGFEIAQSLWKNRISCDFAYSASQTEILDQATLDGCGWIVFIKQTNSLLRVKSRRGPSNFKPLKVRSVQAEKDTDLEYEELVPFLAGEINGSNEDEADRHELNDTDSSLDSMPTGPLFSTDINNRVIVVPNDAPRGRKNNKREKWELENDSKMASANFIKILSNAPVIDLDVQDEVLDMILITPLRQQDEWVRKIVYFSNNFPKSFGVNIYNTLKKEANKGTQWAMLHSSKTDKTCVIDLQRQ